MSKNHALVAVSTGLLRSMNRDQVSAVLGHEITHVSNGDMVTLALIQGVLNTFVMFLARIIGGILCKKSRNVCPALLVGFLVATARQLLVRGAPQDGEMLTCRRPIHRSDSHHGIVVTELTHVAREPVRAELDQQAFVHARPPALGNVANHHRPHRG